MRADKTIRDIAIEKCAGRLEAITSRDLVAAEAHYHVSCYNSYTYCHNDVPVNSNKSKDDYAVIENKIVLKQLFDYNRMDIFKDP